MDNNGGVCRARSATLKLRITNQIKKLSPETLQPPNGLLTFKLFADIANIKYETINIAALW